MNFNTANFRNHLPSEAAWELDRLYTSNVARELFIQLLEAEELTCDMTVARDRALEHSDLPGFVDTSLLGEVLELYYREIEERERAKAEAFASWNGFSNS